MRPQRLSERYVGVDFSGVNLAGAVLDGWFADCDFRDANLTGVRFHGRFVDCDFRGAELHDADDRDAVFVNCRWR